MGREVVVSYVRCTYVLHCGNSSEKLVSTYKVRTLPKGITHKHQWQNGREYSNIAAQVIMLPKYFSSPFLLSFCFFYIHKQLQKRTKAEVKNSRNLVEQQQTTDNSSIEQQRNSRESRGSCWLCERCERWWHILPHYIVRRSNSLYSAHHAIHRRPSPHLLRPVVSGQLLLQHPGESSEE